MRGVEIFMIIVLLIPIYWMLIYGYMYPEESYFWGKRWMYEEEPQLTEEAIDFQKKASLISIIVITLALILIILK